MENAKIVVAEKCHDCERKVEINDGELVDAKMLKYDTGNEKITVIKCDNCFEKNPSLTNFQNCEVYSRIVGYIRPIQQWNAGKRVEYSEREEYKEKEL